MALWLGFLHLLSPLPTYRGAASSTCLLALGLGLCPWWPGGWGSRLLWTSPGPPSSQQETQALRRGGRKVVHPALTPGFEVSGRHRY